MKRRYAIAAIFAASVILCGFQQDPPPEHREAKQQSRQTAQTNTKANAQSANAATAAQSPSKSTEKNSDGVNDNKKQEIYVVTATPEKSVDFVERIISIIGLFCTIALAVVGIIGICLALKTLREMKGQRKAMLGQLRAMREQIGQMQRQATEMEKQTGHLQESVTAAKDNADAAEKSAASAQRNIELVINKERARLRVEEPIPLRLQGDSPVTITYNLSYHGFTPAFDVDSNVNAVISDSRESAVSDFVLQKVQNLPSVVSAQSIINPYLTVVFKMGPNLSIKLDNETFRKINDGKMFVHFWGYIKYVDFFDQPRETTFRYRWIAASPMESWERWEKYGEPRDNHQT